MKRTITVLLTVLLTVLTVGETVSAKGAAVPAWENYASAGGQLDDTGYAQVRDWLLVPGNREAALPNAAGREVLASVIVANARSLVDKYPYVYGGESPEEGGFDCTGLVWYVYNQMSGLDITLSQAGRSKAALAAAGEKIYDHDLFLPGDVIQFTYAHVAIYVGNGRVVHARTTGTMIQETDLNYGNVEYAVRYPGVVQSNVLASGVMGNSLEWTLRSSGELIVSGAGEMPAWSDENAVPWRVFREEITSVTLGSGVTNVGDYAFYGCGKLRSVDAPGASSVGMAAFYDCAALEELTLSNSVTEIGMWAFCRCAKLTELSFSEGLVSIGTNAFYGCSGLKRITLAEGLTVLEDGTFENCSSLQSITIPEGVTRIGESTFFGCLSLTSVTIPKTVTAIGDWAFAYCDALSTVVYTSFAPQWEEIMIAGNNEPLRNAARICTGRPDTPKAALSLAPGSGIPVLTWEKVPHAQRYEIWRKTGDGAFALLAETEGLGYCDTTAAAGTEHYYMIRAVAGDTESEFSDILVLMQMIRTAHGVIPGIPPV